MTVIKMLGVTVFECGLITWLLITANARFKNLHLENKNGNIIDNHLLGVFLNLFFFSIFALENQKNTARVLIKYLHFSHSIWEEL